MAIKENSIEEDIINAQRFINSIKTDKEYKEENGWHGYYNKEIVELARMLEHILSDYKRVQEEFKEVDHECSRLEKKEFELEKENEKLQKENEELRKFILEGVTIEKSPYQNYRLDFLRENFIPIKEIKEKFKKINETKIGLNKINARDYMIFGETETATGWFINIDYIEKILLGVPGYEIESKLKK